MEVWQIIFNFKPVIFSFHLGFREANISVEFFEVSRCSFTVMRSVFVVLQVRELAMFAATAHDKVVYPTLLPKRI